MCGAENGVMPSIFAVGRHIPGAAAVDVRSTANLRNQRIIENTECLTSELTSRKSGL